MKSVVIVGGGYAGISCAIELQELGIDAIVVSGNVGASMISPANMLVLEENELKQKMLVAGHYQNDPYLLDKFVSNVASAINFLQKHGIKLKKSNLGLIPLEKQKTLGQLVRWFSRKGVIVDGEVIGIKNGQVVIKQASRIITLQPTTLVLAHGGFGNLYLHSTYQEPDQNLTAYFHKIGAKCDGLRYNMFHPFFIIDKNLPNALISGTILQKMKFVDEQGGEFLPPKIIKALETDQYHHIFPQMCAAFYNQTKKSKIYAVLHMTDEELEEYVQNGDFGWVFKPLLNRKTRKFEITPAFHYSLGGLVVDHAYQTTIEGVVACGQAMGGLHGANRIGGLGVLEAIVFGREVAHTIKEERLSCDLSSLNIRFHSSTPQIKQQFWTLLGVVKQRPLLARRLQQLKEKEELNAYELLLKTGIEESLAHDSVGLHIIR